MEKLCAYKVASGKESDRTSYIILIHNSFVELRILPVLVHQHYVEQASCLS
ncbi:MAG: hypothetical protein F6J86_07320 [Symploca sp. SIO1B1]|nr:hypothetical protein [Symploca sp. SIO1B1]